MSALHMFLPVSEPARSEALAQLIKTHHVPRHLVRGIARSHGNECGPPAPVRVSQSQQQALPQEPQAPTPQV